MALSIKNEEADALARRLAELTGESLTEVVVISLRERLDRKQAEVDSRPLADRVQEIGRRFRERPRVEGLTADELLGYDEHGLPT